MEARDRTTRRRWLARWALSCGFAVALGAAACSDKTGETSGLAATAGVPGAAANGGSGGVAILPSAGSGGVPSAGAGAGGMPAPGSGGASGGAGTPAPAGASGGGGAGGEDAGMSEDGLRDVLLVGNGVAGTVSFLDARTFENLGSVDVIPDFDEVMDLISGDLLRSVAYSAIKNAQLLHHFEPSGGDRFLDDVFVSPDGGVLYVSRSNLGDVAAFDLTRPGHPQLWRSFVSGLKADHATISHDGKRLVVSATTATVADVFDASNGERIDTFATGDFPHQNDYSADGKHIYNSSIGNVGYQSVSYANNDQKGTRLLVKVDAQTLDAVGMWQFEWGIRPNVITADEKLMYAQLSYLNGVIKYDLGESRELARSDQPLSEFAMSTYAGYDEYPHDSAHHGLALSGDGARLCDCGTIDNTVTIVATATMTVEATIDVGMVPYWATTSPEGTRCFVSLSGDDAISVIDHAEGEQVTVVPVGDFPQRSRLGRLPEAVVSGLLAAGG